MHLLRDSSATSGAFEAYRDAGPSRSDKYDEDDYDDINFKTVSIVDGSHSPLVLTHHAALSPPRGAAAERVQPRAPINAIRAFSAAHAEPSVTQSCSAQYGIPQYENQHALRDLPSASHQAALKLQASKSLEGKSKEKPHATLLAPPPPINLFTKSISAESAAVRSAAEGRIQKHGSS